MSDFKHTPGPWELRVNGVFLRVVNGEHKNTVADGIVSEANAHLIAAAPELLAALVEILGPLNACSDNPNVRDDACLPIDMTMGELRKARAAIAKATPTPGN